VIPKKFVSIPLQMDAQDIWFVISYWY